MSRLGAWWLRTEPKVADWCESLVVVAGLGLGIDKPYPPRLPTERESAAKIAAQLERIANGQPPRCDSTTVLEAEPVSCELSFGHTGPHRGKTTEWLWIDPHVSS